jgi:tetratricopeptide (TPR) repeat protein
MEDALGCARRHAERARDERDRCHILGRLARAAVIGTCPVSEGIRRCHTILADGKGDVSVTAVSETMLAVLHAMDGSFDVAREYWRVSVGRLEHVGLNVTKARMQMYHAFIELMAGRPQDVEPELKQAYQVLDQLGERHHLATMAGVLARVLYAQGRYEDADRSSRDAERLASVDDLVSQMMWRGTRGKVLAQAGDAKRSLQLVDGAVALAEATDFLPLHADALRDQAEALTVLGRARDAARSLDEAISLYECKGIRVAADAALSARRGLTAA